MDSLVPREINPVENDDYYIALVIETLSPIRSLMGDGLHLNLSLLRQNLKSVILVSKKWNKLVLERKEFIQKCDRALFLSRISGGLKYEL
jgi:hypothetical protein